MSKKNLREDDDLLELARRAYDKHRYADAKALYSMFIEESSDCPDADKGEISDTYNNLATTCCRLGQYQEAEEFCQKHIQLLKTLPGKQKSDGGALVAGFTSLSGIQRRLGHLAEAEESIRTALEQAKKSLGKDDLTVGKCWNILGATLEAQSKFKEAESAYAEMLRIKRHNFGDNHSEVAIGLEYLGIFYGNRNRLADAESNFREALEVRRKTSGVDSLEAAHCLNNLAYVCLTKKEYQAALELCEEALAIRRAILERGHPDLHTSERLLSQIKIQLKVAQLK